MLLRRRRSRAPVLALVAMLVGLGPGACGSSSSTPASPTPDSKTSSSTPAGPATSKAADSFAQVADLVCASARADEAGDAAAAVGAFEDAHGGLHDLARAAEVEDRAAAARLLEAKQAVESNPTPAVRRALVAAVATAIQSAGETGPSSCP